MSSKKPKTKIVNPAASTIPTSTPMPFSEVPATVAYREPVRPLTVPRSRQLAPGPNVKIIGKHGGI
jgi:hypothetical protein